MLECLECNHIGFDEDFVNDKCPKCGSDHVMPFYDDDDDDYDDYDYGDEEAFEE